MRTIRKTVMGILLSVLFAGQAISAESFWNSETTARELCFLVTLYLDWQQTRTIAANPDQFRETNPILGSHPKRKEVDLYFGCCALGHALISYLLPPNAAKVWQATWIGIQTDVVEANYDKGLGEEGYLEYRIEFSIPF